MNLHRRALLLAAVAWVLLGGCSSSNKPAAGPSTLSPSTPGPSATITIVAPAPPVVVTITVVATGFRPPAATVAPGANVTWVQADPTKGSVHAIVFGTPRQPNTGISGGPAMAKGASFTVALTVPGTYPYYDRLHPALVATLTVQTR